MKTRRAHTEVSEPQYLEKSSMYTLIKYRHLFAHKLKKNVRKINGKNIHIYTFIFKYI